VGVGRVSLGELGAAGFDVLTRNHAEAILVHDFPRETEALVALLLRVRIDTAELIAGGGGESAFTQRLRRALANAGWPKHVFTVETTVDGVPREAISHEIDHVHRAPAGTLALEIEWNNKDPFFDRDLENFQRLHLQSAVSVGIVVTRGQSLQAAFADRIRARLRADGVTGEDGLARYGVGERTGRQRAAVRRLMAAGADFAEAFTRSFVASKYGQATTHWSKLEARVARGVGNPCPLLLVGLPSAVISEGQSADADVLPLFQGA
jgi:hypothetical protein